MTQHPTNVPPTATSRPWADVARWQVCLHEAGHAVAAQALLKRVASAVVFDDGSGAAYYRRDPENPRMFESAMVLAAGEAASALADHHAPPQVEPAPPWESSCPEKVRPMVATVKETPSDPVALAHWCVRGVETQPERWANRYHWIRREARLFVARHQQEIVEVAAGLYARGIITLQADAAKDGKDHVD